MPPMAILHLSKPLKAVKILTDLPGRGAAALPGTVHRTPPAEYDVSLEAVETQTRLYQETCLTLQEVVARLNEFYREIFSSHHEAIARLSVEIARKVLMRNVRDGDYEIESIIKEALKNAPKSSPTVVRLNPQDLTDLQQLQDMGQPPLSEVELVADAAIGRAECVVENSKGVIKLLIDDHLEQISKALVKTG